MIKSETASMSGEPLLADTTTLLEMARPLGSVPLGRVVEEVAVAAVTHGNKKEWQQDFAHPDKRVPMEC